MGCHGGRSDQLRTTDPRQAAAALHVKLRLSLRLPQQTRQPQPNLHLPFYITHPPNNLFQVLNHRTKWPRRNSRRRSNSCTRASNRTTTSTPHHYYPRLRLRSSTSTLSSRKRNRHGNTSNSLARLSSLAPSSPFASKTPYPSLVTSSSCNPSTRFQTRHYLKKAAMRARSRDFICCCC
jgi:hypothetical protein